MLKMIKHHQDLKGILKFLCIVIPQYLPTLFEPTGEKVTVPKLVTPSLLILDHMLQCKLQLTPDAQNIVGVGGNSLLSEYEDTTLVGARAVDNGKKSFLDDNNKGNSPFMNILGKLWDT